MMRASYNKPSDVFATRHPQVVERERRLVAGEDCPFCSWVTLAILIAIAGVAMLGVAGAAIMLWGPR